VLNFCWSVYITNTKSRFKCRFCNQWIFRVYNLLTKLNFKCQKHNTMILVHLKTN